MVSISISVITGCYVQEKRFWEIVVATIEDLAFGVSSGQWSQKHAAFAPASQRQLGFRLRSPLHPGEEPCPLCLQTVFSTTALRKATKN